MSFVNSRFYLAGYGCLKGMVVTREPPHSIMTASVQLLNQHQPSQPAKDDVWLHLGITKPAVQAYIKKLCEFVLAGRTVTLHFQAQYQALEQVYAGDPVVGDPTHIVILRAMLAKLVACAIDGQIVHGLAHGRLYRFTYKTAKRFSGFSAEKP